MWKRGLGKCFADAIVQDLGSLGGETLIFCGSNNDERFIFDFLRNMGRMPELVKVDNFTDAASIVNKGLGVAFMPVTMHYRHHLIVGDDIPVKALTIRSIPFERQFYLLRRPDFPSSDTEQQILDFIVDKIQNVLALADEYINSNK